MPRAPVLGLMHINIAGVYICNNDGMFQVIFGIYSIMSNVKYPLTVQ